MPINSLFRVLAIAASWLTWATASFAGDVLFYKVSRNYDQEGLVGEVFRRELETRMFTHATWRQRLYGASHDPDVNETLEIYTKSDRSIWLTHRRAVPSISGIIWSRLFIGKKFDLKKELDAVRITHHEVALPLEVANEVELLWKAMLPGLAEAPKPPALHMHTPIFIAFVQKKNSIETGSIAIAAYNTPTYRAFVDVVSDLRVVCDRGGGPTDPIFRKLPDKIRRVRARL
jgi:hypothetical protein